MTYLRMSWRTAVTVPFGTNIATLALSFANRKGARRAPGSAGQQLLDVLRHHVHLEVHPRPREGGAERRALQRLGDERHVEARVVDPRDGERDAVDGDRP